LTIDKNLRTRVYGRLQTTAADKEAADTLTMPEANMALVQGTTQIDNISATGWTAGSTINLRFDSTTVVSGTGNIALSGGASSKTMLPGWQTQLVYDGTNFLEQPGVRRELGATGGVVLVDLGAKNALQFSGNGNFFVITGTDATSGVGIDYLDTRAWPNGSTIQLFRDTTNANLTHLAAGGDDYPGYGPMYLDTETTAQFPGLYAFTLYDGTWFEAWRNAHSGTI
jgi:hypothetical protein